VCSSDLNPQFDESEHANYVAKKLGTEHYSEEFSVSDVIPIFSEVSKKLDEPFFDPSMLPTYKVSKLARQHVKVALSGDGGDELFGGYPTYQAGIIASYINFMPKSYLLGMSNLLDIVPDSVFNLFSTSFKDYSKKRLAKIMLAGMQKDGALRHLYWMRTFFLGDKTLYKEPGLDFLDSILGNIDKSDTPSLKSQYVDFNTYLRDDFLFKSDRASMYNSLEVRVPFLDNDVINYAFSAKKSHVNLFKTKIILRNLLKDKLPEISKRPKKGFGIPLAGWLRGELKDFGFTMLSNSKLKEFIDGKKILSIWKEHQEGKRDHSGVIWQTIVFSGWLNNWY
jgi:asparagine synthase (glutamine-hydrolysing)